MFAWTLMFLVMAVIAGVLGFGGAHIGAVLIIRILFFVLIYLFLGGVLYGLVTGRRPPMPPV